MARDEEISGIYNISGTRPIGVARVFPKVRVVRKEKKEGEVEKEKPDKRKKEPPSNTPRGPQEHVDIEV